MRIPEEESLTLDFGDGSMQGYTPHEHNQEDGYTICEHQYPNSGTYNLEARYTKDSGEEVVIHIDDYITVLDAVEPLAVSGFEMITPGDASAFDQYILEGLSGVTGGTAHPLGVKNTTSLSIGGIQNEYDYNFTWELTGITDKNTGQPYVAENEEEFFIFKNEPYAKLNTAENSIFWNNVVNGTPYEVKIKLRVSDWKIPEPDNVAIDGSILISNTGITLNPVFTGINDKLLIEEPTGVSVYPDTPLPTNTEIMEPGIAASFFAVFTDVAPYTSPGTSQWEIKLQHEAGEYIWHTGNSSFIFYDYKGTWWNPVMPVNLPIGYNWNYSLQGNIKAKVVCTTIDSDGYEHGDMQYVELVARPVLTGSDSRIIFNQVFSESESLQRFTITNTGILPATINDIILHDEDNLFMPANDPTGKTINPGEALMLDIIYAPAGPGNSMAELMINYGGQMPLKISIEGNSILQPPLIFSEYVNGYQGIESIIRCNIDDADEYEWFDPDYGFSINTQSNEIMLQQISGIENGGYLRLQVKYRKGDNWSNPGIQFFSIPALNLNTQILNCGKIKYELNEKIECEHIYGASSYKWQFRSLDGTVHEIYSDPEDITYLNIADIVTTLGYGKSYYTSVSAYSQQSGEWGNYSDECLVLMPNLPAVVITDENFFPVYDVYVNNHNHCEVYFKPVPGAELYEMRIEYSNNTYHILAFAGHKFLISPDYLHAGENAQIEIRAKVDGHWGFYGQAATLHIPDNIITDLQYVEIGTTEAFISFESSEDDVLIKYWEAGTEEYLYIRPEGSTVKKRGNETIPFPTGGGNLAKYVIFTGLTPATTYYYEIIISDSNSGIPGQKIVSPEMSFTTLPEADIQHRFSQVV